MSSERQVLIHLHSETSKVPATGVLNKGEIAVQYNNADPALYIEKADGSIAKFLDSGAVATEFAKYATSAETVNAIEVEKVRAEGVEGGLETRIEALEAISGETNAIESVKVNGEALTPDEHHAVDVTITSGTANGTLAVNGRDVAVTGLGSAAFADSADFDESGAAETVKTELIGTMSGDTKTLGALQDAIAGLDLGEDNVIEGVQVNGSDLTVDANKKVNVTITSGSTNGTIAVNGADVYVKGLGSAAFEDASAFESAGTAAAEIAALDLENTYAAKSYEDKVDTLIGEDSGKTARKIAEEELARQLIPEDAKEAFDTLQEIAAWIQQHPDDAAEMNAEISTLSGDVNTISGHVVSLINNSGDTNVLEGVQVNGADLTIDANKKVNVTVTSGSANGTIAVNGADVNVSGLGSAAFKDESAFESAGTADAVKTELIGTMSGDTKTLGALQEAIAGLGDVYLTDEDLDAAIAAESARCETAYDAKGAADTIYDSATTYADSLAVNYDASGSAASALTEAKAYADGLISSAATSASGDAYVSAEIVDGELSVEATQSTKDSLALADSSLQGIATGKDCGVAVDSDKKLDFTLIHIDCGTY